VQKQEMDQPPLPETNFIKESPDPDETKLGKKLSELTTKMVMILVLTFMISVPIFTNSTYKDDSFKYEYGLNLVAEFYPKHDLVINKTFQ
jgi:hypothetical protein